MLPTSIGASVDLRGDHTSGDQSRGTFYGVTLLGFTLHGQYLSSRGYGGYASIPFHVASGSSSNGVGNVEVGGLYSVQLSPCGLLLVRAGVALNTVNTKQPTAGEADGGQLTPFSHFAPRQGDALTTGNFTSWARAHASYRHTVGNLRLGVSGGIDVPLTGDVFYAFGLGLGINAVANISASAGVELANVGFGVGLVTLVAVGNDCNDLCETDDGPLVGLNATVDYPASPALRVYAAFGYPDLADNAFDIFSIGAGIRVVIH